MSNETKRRVLATGSAFLGLVLLMFGFFLLNRLAISNNDNAKRSSKISIAESVKKKSEVKKTAPPKKSKPKKSVPAPQINSEMLNLSGNGFAVDWLSSDAINGESLKSLKNAVMTADVVDEAPEIVAKDNLSYPAFARSKGLEGFVTFNLLVDARGQIEKTQILDSEPAGIFDAIAMENIRTWQFKPAKYNGRKVRVWSKQTIRFQLN